MPNMQQTIQPPAAGPSQPQQGGPGAPGAPTPVPPPPPPVPGQGTEAEAGLMANLMQQAGGANMPGPPAIPQ